MPKIVVDFNNCSGEATCVSVCPVNVFDMKNLPEYTDTQKSVPTRMQDCIECMACVASCPTNAITVTED